MNMRDIQAKYGLSKNDFWQLKRGLKSIWILTHDAVEKIGSQEGVKILSPTWLAKGEGSTERWALEVRGYIESPPSTGGSQGNPISPPLGRGGGRPPDSEMLWTTGEADTKNCKTDYPVAICEKRAKDRLILKLIRAYEEGIYSESEAEVFKRPNGNS